MAQKGSCHLHPRLQINCTPSHTIGIRHSGRTPRSAIRRVLRMHRVLRRIGSARIPALAQLRSARTRKIARRLRTTTPSPARYAVMTEPHRAARSACVPYNRWRPGRSPAPPGRSRHDGPCDRHRGRSEGAASNRRVQTLCMAMADDHVTLSRHDDHRQRELAVMRPQSCGTRDHEGAVDDRGPDLGWPQRHRGGIFGLEPFGHRRTREHHALGQRHRRTTRPSGRPIRRAISKLRGWSGACPMKVREAMAKPARRAAMHTG